MEENKTEKNPFLWRLTKGVYSKLEDLSEDLWRDITEGNKDFRTFIYELRGSKKNIENNVGNKLFSTIFSLFGIASLISFAFIIGISFLLVMGLKVIYDLVKSFLG